MKLILKGTRALLNAALATHRAAVLTTVDNAYKAAEKAATDVVQQKKFVQLAKERELELLDVSSAAWAAAKTLEAVAEAELSKLPSYVA